MTLYFEDLAAGDEWTSDAYEITQAEIIEFAEQYDPQWFHTDPERAAEESIYGSLIAAGFHTAAISTRLFLTFRSRHRTTTARSSFRGSP